MKKDSEKVRDGCRRTYIAKVVESEFEPQSVSAHALSTSSIAVFKNKKKGSQGSGPIANPFKR